MSFPIAILFRSSRVVGALAAACALVRAQEPSAAGVSLTALASEIAANNPELAFYAAEVEAARATGRVNGAVNDPELSFDLGRKRVKDAAGALAGEGTAWSVSVTQTIEWPGRLALRKAIANRQVELAELGLARFRQALEARARTLGFGLFAANAKAEATREVADRFSVLKETFLGREPAGITPLLETRVIEAAELALQRRATNAELEVQAALIELNQLRGAAPAASLRVATPTLALNDAPPVETLLRAARENSFDYRMRQIELAQQGLEVRLARHARHPAVSVGPFVSQENAGERETTFGVGVSLPLPVTSRQRGGVEVAEARRRQADVALLIAQRELEREVLVNAQAFTTKLGEFRRWSDDAVQRFREAADLADRHYRLGAVSVATYVELQNSYLDAVEALLDTQREVLESGLKLQQLTGVDFRAVEVRP